MKTRYFFGSGPRSRVCARALSLCLSLACAGGLLLEAEPVLAQQAKSIAVLNIEGDGVDRDTADTLSAVVRNEAQQIAQYQVVNSTSINLSEVVVLLGCDVSNVECLVQAADQLDANMLVYGLIIQEQDAYRLRLAIFDANLLKITYRMQKVIPSSDDLVFEARQEIETFFQGVKKEQVAARLTLSSNVRGAQVLLDGEPIGNTPLEQQAITPGSYKIEVKKEGFTSWSAEMEFGERAQVKLRAPLKPLPKDVASNQTNTTGQGGTSSTVVTTVPDNASGQRRGGTGGGIGEDLDVRSQRSGVNIGAVSLVSIGGVGLIASGITALRMNQLSEDLTARAQRGELTVSEREDGIEKGLALQRTHRVLLGVGAVAVAAGGIWLLVDRSSSRETNVTLKAVGVEVSTTSVQGVVRW